ncbi:MAG: glycosyltransferase [Candidatus Gastranaerophilales bacterium]|nr:glycosyltransferase [Candidatus Gastranaerophilales bacterium]
MDKEKVLFIAHQYHEKTKSCDFMIELFSDFFDVDVSYGMPQELNTNYNTIIFLQVSPDKKTLKNLKNKNIIFFPMYDAVRAWKFKDWYLLRNCKIINFSKKIHAILKEIGLNSIYLQYFIEPKEFSKGNKNEVFFWQRVEPINFEVIKKLFEGKNYKIHLHKATDPNNNFLPPSESDEVKYGITYTDWFDSKKEMWDLIAKKQIFIAPRVAEGIGMSFLEAMAMGKVIVANDEPTMNEYIRHGINGYLFDFNNPTPMDFSDIDRVQKNSWEFCKQGYQKWLEEKSLIIEFIKSKRKSVKISFLKKVKSYLFFERL